MTFQNASGQPFLLGVNYWPRRKAMYWWADFDAGEVRDEFTLIRDLGMTWVRIFLLWEDWQPRPDAVNQQALADLETVADIAADLGLKLDITFFVGHMSGPNWAPAWLLRPDGSLPAPGVRQVVSRGRAVDAGYANMFTDVQALDAARLLLRTVVAALHPHPGVGMWNLGNEPDLFAWPTNAAAGRAWVREMTGVIRAIDDAHPITCGLHTANLLQDNGLRVHDVFAETDVAVMHGYPMYIEWARDPLDPEFVPYLCALTAALSGKPCLMEEFGGPTQPPGRPSGVWEWTSYGKRRQQFLASEEDFAAYLEATLHGLVEAGALGAFLWCFADYDPALWDRPPCDESWHERHFGLIRPDGSLKPHAEVIRRFAATHPQVQSPARVLQLDIAPETYYLAPWQHARRLYYQAWLA